jgi:hypothetical protein
MNAKRLIIFVAVFGLGFTSAWFSKSDPAVQQEIPSATATASERAERPVKDAKNPRTGELLKALGDARYSELKTKEALDQIKTEEFPRLIDELVRQAGFTGLDYRAERTLNDLIASWFERDPDAALGWATALENAKDREKLLGEIFRIALKKDLGRGVALVQQYGRKEDGGWEIPPEIFRLLGHLSPEEMVRTVGAFVSSNGATSSEVETPNGFDFRSALDGLRQIENGFRKGESLAIMPALMTRWAKLDPKSAWEWLQQGKEVPFNGVEEFFKGYRSVASTDEFVSFLAEATDAGVKAPGEDRFRLAWQTLAEEPSPEALSAFLPKLAGERSQNLRDFFGTASTGSGGDYDRFKEILLQQMSPEERMDVLPNYFKRGRSSEHSRKFYTPILRQLGHSEQEIQRMLSPTANH